MRRAILLLFVLIFTAIPPAFAAKRVALVVGIDAYDNLPTLQKAVNDKKAVAEALTGLGFDVISGENLNRREINAKLAELDAKIAPGDTVFFYFAGHGLALGAENYLLPCDLPKPRDGEENLVRDEGHAVDAIVRRVQSRGAAVSFFVLDACRDNPIAASGVRSIGGTRGLTRVDTPNGVFVLFSAGLGQTALDRLSDDDPDPNSVFTRQLVPLLKTPGLTQVALAKRVQREVDALAASVRHPQQPAYYDQIIGEIEISPAVGSSTSPQTPTATPSLSAPSSPEQAKASSPEPQTSTPPPEDQVFTQPSPIAPTENEAPTSEPKKVVIVTPPAPATPPKAVEPAVGVFPKPEIERGYKPGDAFKDCAVCPEMVVVPAGEFMMGSPSNEDGRESNEGPEHRVRIVEPFAVGRAEVTVDEWYACVSDGGCEVTPQRGNGRQPVTQVSWQDANTFTEWLSDRTGKTYRLLSEAEWEYSARAGAASAFSSGAAITSSDANYRSTPGPRPVTTMPVRSFRPNAFGLFDIHGNVQEWVKDCWHDSYDGAPSVGIVWSGNCEPRVLRGGGWHQGPNEQGSASRGRAKSWEKGAAIGFRVARTLTP